jgi:hypothetical protein
MTVEEFHTLAQRREGERRTALRAAPVVGIVTVILFFTLYAYLVIRVEPAIPDGLARSLFRNALPFSMACGVAAILMPLILWCERHLSRGMRCPECRGQLLRMHQVVVSSRRCYHCGSVVLREGEPSPDET